MQTNGDRSKKYVAFEKEYDAIEKEIQKHPHQGSLGSRDRTRREGETRRQVEKEVEKERLAVKKEIQTPDTIWHHPTHPSKVRAPLLVQKLCRRRMLAVTAG